MEHVEISLGAAKNNNDVVTHFLRKFGEII